MLWSTTVSHLHIELGTISLTLTWFVSIPQLKPWGSPIVGCESSEAVFCNSKFIKSWRLLELKVTLMGLWAQQIFCFGSNILARDNKVPVMTVNKRIQSGPLNLVWNAWLKGGYHHTSWKAHIKRFHWVLNCVNSLVYRQKQFIVVSFMHFSFLFKQNQHVYYYQFKWFGQ